MYFPQQWSLLFANLTHQSKAACCIVLVFSTYSIGRMTYHPSIFDFTILPSQVLSSPTTTYPCCELLQPHPQYTQNLLDFQFLFVIPFCCDFYQGAVIQSTKHKTRHKAQGLLHLSVRCTCVSIHLEIYIIIIMTSS